MAFEMTSVFDVMAADETDQRVTSRRALALAHTRVDNHLGRFLRAAVTTDDFETRLGAVQEQLSAYVADACDECGHTHPEHIAKSIVDHYSRTRRWQPRNVVAAPMGPMDMGQPGMGQGQPMPLPGMGPTPEQQMQQPGQPGMGSMPAGQEPGGMAPQPPAPQGGVTQPMQQAQQMMQQNPQNPLQPGGQQPGMPPMMGSAEGRGFLAANNPSDQSDDSSDAVSCPECGGSGKTNGDKTCHKCGGKGKVANFGDSVLDHVARLAGGDWGAEGGEGISVDKRTLRDCPTCDGSGKNSNGDECPKCNGDGAIKVAAGEGNTGLSKPEPKMDKRRWTPQNVKKPSDEGSRVNPVKNKDIIEPIRSVNRDMPGHDLTEIGEQTTKHIDLGAGGDTETGFYDGGETKGPFDWQRSRSQADPVTHTKQ